MSGEKLNKQEIENELAALKQERNDEALQDARIQAQLREARELAKQLSDTTPKADPTLDSDLAELKARLAKLTPTEEIPAPKASVLSAPPKAKKGESTEEQDFISKESKLSEIETLLALYNRSIDELTGDKDKKKADMLARTLKQRDDLLKIRNTSKEKPTTKLITGKVETEETKISDLDTKIASAKERIAETEQEITEIDKELAEVERLLALIETAETEETAPEITEPEAPRDEAKEKAEEIKKKQHEEMLANSFTLADIEKYRKNGRLPDEWVLRTELGGRWMDRDVVDEIEEKYKKEEEVPEKEVVSKTVTSTEFETKKEEAENPKREEKAQEEDPSVKNKKEAMAKIKRMEFEEVMANSITGEEVEKYRVNGRIPDIWVFQTRMNGNWIREDILQQIDEKYDKAIWSGNLKDIKNVVITKDTLPTQEIVSAVEKPEEKILSIGELKNEIKQNIQNLLENEKVKPKDPALLEFDLLGNKSGIIVKAKVKLQKAQKLAFGKYLSTTIDLELQLKNDKDQLTLGGHELTASLGESTVKKELEPVLPSIIPGIQTYFEGKYDKKIDSMSIENGSLKIVFEK